MTHGLSNSLWSSKLYLFLYTPFSSFRPHIVRSSFLKELVLLPFGQHPCLTAIQQVRADQGLVDDEFVGRERFPDCNCLRSPKKHLFAVSILQTHVVVRCHQGSQTHKFFDDFKSFVSKCHYLPNVANRSLVPCRKTLITLIPLNS
jgi:hypothetical protein